MQRKQGKLLFGQHFEDLSVNTSLRVKSFEMSHFSVRQRRGDAEQRIPKHKHGQTSGNNNMFCSFSLHYKLLGVYVLL